MHSKEVVVTPMVVMLCGKLLIRGFEDVIIDFRFLCRTKWAWKESVGAKV